MLEARPPAKINLALEVGDRRPDGFHELRSVFVRIGLSDRLILRTADHSDTDTLTVAGADDVPIRGNLVLRAFHALRAHTGVPLPPLHAELHKHIPAAAGLGGGSSDAAAALILAQVAWGISLPPRELVALGASVGSDVPFFLADEALAEVGGRGEFVSPLPSDLLDFGILLVSPPVALSTARVFAQHDRMPARASDAGVAAEALLALAADRASSDAIVSWSQQHADANDLWQAAAALEPSLVSLRQALELETRRTWHLSGSGPTLFALYASAREAADAGKVLVDRGFSELQSAIINAVDLDGPDPIWRYP